MGAVNVAEDMLGCRARMGVEQLVEVWTERKTFGQAMGKDEQKRGLVVGLLEEAAGWWQ